MDDSRLDNMLKLLEENVEDNVSLVESINRIIEGQNDLRTDLLREFKSLREDFTGQLVFRALKDLCVELVSPLSAMEAMLKEADFTDPITIRNHLNSIVVTIQSVLSRMGAEKIAISPGEDMFNPDQHLCISLRKPEDSPFPDAPPRTIVHIIEDGYTLGDRILSSAKVDVQSEK